MTYTVGELFLWNSSRFCKHNNKNRILILTGKLAWRETDEGGWLIKCLNSVIKEVGNNEKIDLVETLVKTSAAMAKEGANFRVARGSKKLHVGQVIKTQTGVIVMDADGNIKKDLLNDDANKYIDDGGFEVFLREDTDFEDRIGFIYRDLKSVPTVHHKLLKTIEISIKKKSCILL